MIKRDKLINFINKTLNYEKGKDLYLFNGLQVIGKETVKKIVLGVSPSLELFEKAAQWSADMIILHHGILGPKVNMPIGKVLKNRLKVLFDTDITLLTYHLFLDNHPTLGNNAQIVKLLGAKRGEKFGFMEKLWWGFEGEFSKAITIDELVRRCKKLCGPSTKVFKFGQKLVKKFGVVSGGGPYILPEAIDKKLDAFLTGEPKEWSETWTKEAEINYIYLGHYNSEKFGVLALGDFLKKKFPSLQFKFIDIPNRL